MPRQALITSKAVARLLRRRRQQLGLSLRDVQRRSAAEGRPIPFSTLAKIEQAKVDPGVKRLHHLMRLYHLPMQAAGDLLDLEAIADVRPEIGDPATLYREGVEHLKRGETRKGLAHLFALRERLPDESDADVMRYKALLSFAIAAGSLGRYRLSLQIVEDVLVESLDRPLLIATLVQAGAVWNGLGSSEAALAFFDRAASHLEDGDHESRAWIAHGKAVALRRQGRIGVAEVMLDEAVESYRKAGDAYGEARTAGARVKLRVSAGDLPGALSIALDGKEQARRHGFERLRVLRLLDEGFVRVAMGDASPGLAALSEALGSAVASEDNAARFYAHYHLWKAHLTLDDPERAAVECEAARYYVRFVDEASDEAEEIRGDLKWNRKPEGLDDRHHAGGEEGVADDMSPYA